MKLGAEPKKLAALGVLLVIAAITYYMMSSDGSPSPSAPVAATTVQTSAAVSPALTSSVTPVRRTRAQLASRDFKPTIGARDPKDRPDPATIDPTLRLDLLAKVQNIEAGAPGRNLFQFGSAPAPPPPPMPKDVPKINTKMGPVQPTAPPPPPGPPPAPQAPQMTFKYYGFKVSKSDGHKAAFLLDGEDILVTSENDTFKQRYRVVRIGLTSITIEDTQFKTTQTLQIQENPAA